MLVRTIGVGTCMTRLKDQIGLEIKTLSNIFVKKLLMLLLSLNVMAFHLAEMKMERYINELLEE
jgi:hypothetical protein